MDDNWKAHIVFRPEMLASAVYLYREVGNSREYLLADGSIVSADRTSVIKDDPKLAFLHDEQLKALGIAISKNGYQAPNEHLIEGKLLATERHLEDMRKLVFDAPELHYSVEAPSEHKGSKRASPDDS